jgi:hypothetical protein
VRVGGHGCETSGEDEALLIAYWSTRTEIPYNQAHWSNAVKLYRHCMKIVQREATGDEILRLRAALRQIADGGESQTAHSGMSRSQVAQICEAALKDTLG